MSRLVDTSVWVDHLARGDAQLAALLESGDVLIHPMILGEIALGSLRDRSGVLRELGRLPRAAQASHDEAMHAVEAHGLYGTGLGYVDAHLIASALLTPGARLLTRDRRLLEQAQRLGLA